MQGRGSKPSLLPDGQGPHNPGPSNWERLQLVLQGHCSLTPGWAETLVTCLPRRAWCAAQAQSLWAHWPLWVKVSDLGQKNNPNTTPIKGLQIVRVVVCLCSTRGEIAYGEMLLHQRDDADADRGHSWWLGVMEDKGNQRLEPSYSLGRARMSTELK